MRPNTKAIKEVRRWIRKELANTSGYVAQGDIAEASDLKLLGAEALAIMVVAYRIELETMYRKLTK